MVESYKGHGTKILAAHVNHDTRIRLDGQPIFDSENPADRPALDSLLAGDLEKLLKRPTKMAS